MAIPKKISELCTPSRIYFWFSAILLVAMAIQNIGNTHMYHLGCYSCVVPHTILIFAFKLMYVLFWTWILNLICKDGYKNIAWLFVLFPILLLFVLLGVMMLQ